MLSLKKFAAFSFSTLLLAGTAIAGQFTVESGDTKALRLSEEAGNVVIGNQNIADVSVVNSKLLLISGKVFGTTNLMVFDGEGKAIYSADIVVTTNTANLVTVNRAGANFSYDCAPECRPGFVIGDEAEHFANVFRQVEQQKQLNE
ncbi:MAG: pilus assembly protein N-terminal domain-containing protein [Pseudomonadota bacterium]